MTAALRADIREEFARMPTYDYKCKACGHQFEIFHSMSEVKRKCPECGKSALERMIGTGGAVIFKGSGFYQTDYRSESYKKAAESEKGSKPESKPEAKPDSKPDTKAEAKADPKPARRETKPEKPAKKAG
jgi:putative FmdB family regulatory protein